VATTIDPLFDPRTVEEPHSYFAQLRETDPVHQVPGTDAFLVTRMDLIHEVVANTKTYSSSSTEFLHLAEDGTAELVDVLGNAGEMDDMGSALATADPPDHTRQRKILTPLFTTAVMASRESEFRALVDDALDRLLPAGRLEWMADVAEPLPMLMVTRLLGVADEHAPTLKAQGYSSVEAIGGFVTEELRPTLLTAMAEFGPVLDAFLAARASSTPNTSTVIGTCAQAVEAGELSEGEVFAILGTLISAGGESTTSLLGTGARILAEQPVLQQRLRDEPSLIPTFVEEALRIDPPFRGHYRRTTRDTILGGTTIPAGARAVLVWPAANRDPGAFERPEDIDLDRPNARQHVGFGWGIHLCLGAPLARIEARITFERLLTRTSSFTIEETDTRLEHHKSLMIRRLVELPLVIELAT